MAELTDDEIQREQERLDLLQQQNQAVKNLTAAYEALKKLKGNLSDKDKESINLAKALTGISKNIESSIQKRLSGSASAKDLAKSLNKLEQDRILLGNKLRDLDQTIANNRAKAAADAAIAGRAEQRQKQTLNDLEEEAMDIAADREAALRAGDTDEVKRQNRLAKAKENDIKIAQKGLDNIVKEKEAQEELVKALDEEKEAHETLKKQLDEELKSGEKALEQERKKNLWNVLEKKFNVDFIKDLTNAETAAIALYTVMLDSALKFNEISVKSGKSLGYGADQADRVATNLVDIAQNAASFSEVNGNNMITLKNLGEAMGELNTATGGVAEYSADALTTQVMLTKQFGLTGEEAAGIYKFSVLTGKSSEKVNDEMVGAFVATRNATKGSADFKATMAEASKISGQLAANLQNNPALITKAVVQAQALGTTLEKTKEQGRQLLDFESSIESELKAELLTGQQMNLERARAAALQGDQVTVMKELANQGMTLNKFQNMNVIAQESFAKALGLSADELANQLTKQKIAQEQGKSLAELNKEEALEAEKRQVIQDKFNAAMDKLKDMIGNLVAGPLAMFLDGLTSALTIVGYIVKPIMWIADAAAWIGKLFAGWADALGPVGIVLKVMAGVAIIIAAMAANAALAWIPVVGPILGAAAAVAVIAKGFSALSSAESAGDMMSPADGKTQVSTKEGGLFELSKNDDLVAAPGAAKALKGGGGNIDLTPMINAINATTAAVNRLYSKDSSVHMDGKKVGTTLSQNSHKVA